MKSTAKFVLSKKKLEKQLELLSIADSISYSFKTNPEVGKILEESTDCTFSVHSYELLDQIKDTSRIWLFAQAWDNDEIKELTNKGISKFVVDNLTDLATLEAYLNDNKTNIQLLLRMRLKENTVHTGKHFVFGLSANEANNAIEKLKDNPQIEKLGIHFHRKTQNISEWSLKEELLEALTDNTLKNIQILNIGGGLPVEYKNSHPQLQPILNEITKLKEWLTNYNIHLIIEPGRFLSAPCIDLHTTIKNIYEDNIIVDASVYNTALDTFGAHIRLKVEGELEQTKAPAWTIKGATPCSLDIYRYRVYLKDPKPGDNIIFKNAGAYNFATDFCGLGKIKTEVVD